MRFSLIGLLIATCTIAVGAETAPKPATPVQEVWAVQFDTPYGVMDVNLLCEGRKVVAAHAFTTVLNAPFKVDVSRLSLTDGKLLGPATFTALPVVYTAATEPAKQTDSMSPEEAQLDLSLADGRITGTVSTTQPVRLGLLEPSAKTPLTARGKTFPQAPADNARVELVPLGIGSTGRELMSAHGLGLVVTAQLKQGKIVEAVAMPISGGFQADPPLTMPDLLGVELVKGDRVAARLPLRYTRPKADKPALDGVLTLDGAIIDGYAVGTAKWEADGKSIDSSFRARISRAAAARSLDISHRTWEPRGTAQPADAKLIQRAAEESMVPLRPGEPDKQPFYSTRLIHLSGREGTFHSLFPPATEFAEVAGAAKYRITVAPHANPPGNQSWSFEADKPWRPLTPIWKDIPIGQRLLVTVTALDAAGKELSQAAIPATNYGYVGGNPLDYDHWKIRSGGVAKDGKTFATLSGVPIARRQPFGGPYYKHDLSAVDSALASARLNAYALDRARYRGLYGWGNFTGGDGGDNVYIAANVRALSQIVRWSPDPVEQREALDLAERMAWMMFSAHRDRFPLVYKGVVANVYHMGMAYLDAYAAGRDPRMREAALNLAGVLAKRQDPDGGWSNDQGFPGGVFGPSEFRTNGGEPMLVFFGRVRTELGVNDFVQSENRAHEWVKKNCLPAMMWQNVGYHSLEMVLIQDSTAPHALAYCIWMLDLAPKDQRNLAIVADIARWCEEKHVDWSRDGKPATPRLTQPSCWGWSRASGNGLNVAGRLAYVMARLGQENGDELWKAKAEGLVQSIIAAQDPVGGGYRHDFLRSSGSGDWLHYDAVEAGDRVAGAGAKTGRTSY